GDPAFDPADGPGDAAAVVPPIGVRRLDAALDGSLRRIQSGVQSPHSKGGCERGAETNFPNRKGHWALGRQSSFPPCGNESETNFRTEMNPRPPALGGRTVDSKANLIARRLRRTYGSGAGATVPLRDVSLD